MENTDSEWTVSAGGGDFAHVDQGLHAATVKKISSPVEEECRYNPGKMKRKVTFTYEVESLAPNGERMTIPRKYTLSTNPKSNMRPDVESILARKLTAEEEQAFDIRNLIGRPCKVLVKHTPKDDGGFWSNVDSVLPADNAQPF
tara:strand:+ start:2105 stop:2536 length:432 start_codon:yes stop_codon:yes gene_type:complete